MNVRAPMGLEEATMHGADPAAWAAGLAYLGTVKLQALHGCDTPQPEGVTNEEGYFAQEAYKRATGAPVLGVGITNALGAAAAVRRAYKSDMWATPTDAHMIRAVLVESVDINAMGRAVWTIDLLRAGHGERPFHPGDLVIRTPGFQGFFEVFDIELDTGSHHRIGLVVKPAPDLAFDLEPAPPVDDEADEF